jgi:hypothetical protein
MSRIAIRAISSCFDGIGALRALIVFACAFALIAA